MLDSLKPVGHVVITDKNTGKILVDKDNMVLRDGRRFLAAMFGVNAFVDENNNAINLVNGQNDSNEDYIYYNNFKLNCIILRESTAAPKYDTVTIVPNIMSGSEPTARIIKFKEDNKTGNLSLEINEDEDYPYLKIDVDYADSQKIGNAEMTQLASIVIGMKGNSNTYSTFSHISFDPITITDDTALNIKYYIYF